MRDFLAAVRARLPSPPLREALPPALLLLALSSVFVFGNDRGYLYRPGHHDFITAQTMTVAANLTPDDGFQMCRRRKLLRDGEPACAFSHNAYPLGPFALVRLAAEAAGDSPARQLYAARLLTLACFAGAAALAYLALARLLGDRWTAATATLLAWSSYYLLYYADQVAFQVTALLGVMLTFHGMVLFAQEGRFRQLALKTAAALLLGWHAVALVAPFVLLGLAGALVRARADGGPRPYARRALSALARSPYLAYGLLAVLCFGLLAGWAAANEYAASGGGTPPTGLRVFDSLWRRTGFAGWDQDFDAVGWPRFLLQQLGGVGGSAIPFAFADRLGLDPGTPDLGYWPPIPWFAALGAAVLAACAAGLRALPRLPHRALLAALLLAGWCWAIPLRGSVALHEYEAMLHAGSALVLFALAPLGLRRLIGRERAARALPALAVAALAVFALSAWQAGRAGHDAAAAARERETSADFRAIRRFTEGRSVVVGLIDGAFRAHTKNFLQMRNYWLAGGYLQIEGIGSEQAWREAAPRYDYVVLSADLGGSLTPDNGRFFLYRLDALPDIRAAAAAGEPALRAAYDLRLDGRALTYVRERCGGEDADPDFFLDAVPLDAADLPADRRAAGFERLGGAFADHAVRFDGACVARIALPDYPVAGVRTGQRQGDLPPVWEASLPVADPAFPRRAATWHGTLAGREPALRAAFGVYLDGRTLTYAREECAAADTAARFFLHAVPLDPADLPEERRASGFANLDFDFAERGARFGGRCLASAELPDYPLARVRTGQFTPDGEVWAGGFAIPAAE